MQKKNILKPYYSIVNLNKAGGGGYCRSSEASGLQLRSRSKNKFDGRPRHFYPTERYRKRQGRFWNEIVHA